MPGDPKECRRHAQPRAFALNRLAVVIDRIALNAAFEANNRNFRYCDC
jgi:hypothetical protein